MKNILVPTDFSENATHALRYAQRLFETEHVRFTLFHAYQPSPIQLLGKSPHRVGHYYQLEEKQAKSQLEATLSQIAHYTDNKRHIFVTQTTSGTLLEALQALSISEFDLIVMGSKGASGVKQLILGSNTYRVIKEMTRIPILVIPDQAKYANPKKIAFATNFTRPYAHKEIAPMLDILSLWQASLRIIEVYYDPLLTETQEQNLSNLEEMLAGINYHLHVIPHFNSIETALRVFNEELDIDLLAMIRYPRSFFQDLVREPIIKKMSYHAKVPLLILPALAD
ncbi:MAG: universal stress protein [Dokdonia sp.]|jgi:nucleotide-binding universal stress UspA family protein|nr:hypothetical protein [Cytophagaceae bacterium]